MTNDGIELIDVPHLSGEEEILNGITIRDFWAWALGDLRLNANRGMLAQFLVAKALGDTRPRDDGWGNFDVLTDEGTKVEVKSSGYLQSWSQRHLSNIKFSGLMARSWDEVAGYSLEAEVRADVYVFAVHTCREPSFYDPLNIELWDFYVLPASKIRGLGQKTLTLSRLVAIAPAAVKSNELRLAVSKATEEAK